MSVRTTDEWIGATPDTPVPLRVRVRVFERQEGRCAETGRKIMPGEKWECDHIIAIINGGQNRESNLRVILAEKHKEKTAEDVKLKSKIARVRAKHLGQWPRSKHPIKSRGFSKGRNSAAADQQEVDGA